MSGLTNAFRVSLRCAAFAAAFLFVAAAASPASAQLTVTPITWDVVGLDHNRPLTSGPELFPSGARVCSATATTNVEVDFVWTDGNGSGWDFGPGHPYINLRPGSLTSLDFAAIGAGECVDAYFEVRVTRSASAFGQSREYSIVATDGNGSASSPQPRQILVEQLVSQNRNTTTQIRYGQQEDESDWVTLGYGGSINLAIGNTYFLELTTETSTSYEELQSFLTLSNTIFQVLGASTTYGDLTAPPSRVPVPNPGLWADGCLWDSDPGSPNYSSCLSTGKAGGVVVTTYEILIISGGGDSVSLSAMIYDRSGSSFHYNTDFSTPQGDLVTYDPAGSLLSKRFVPDTIGLGGTSRLRFTITNPNPVAISGYNFLDELPAGVLVESPANATTTCGGTVTAVPGTDEIALAGGFVGAGGSCTVLVDVTAAVAGTYNNVSQNLFIGDADTGNNAAATLTVSATDPPVVVCDENATLALWQFPTGSSATAPAATSSLVTVSTAAGTGLLPTIDTQTNDVGTRSWQSDNINTGALNTANLEYFQFTIDTTGLDSITLDFASRRTSQGPQNVQLYYGATGTETASSVYSLPAQNTWYSQGPTVLSTGLNSSGNTVFRLYVYNAAQNNNGHSIFIDGVRFRGLFCEEVPPPPPTPGVNPPTIAKNFSPTPIGVGHESTLTFTIANPNPVTALSGIAFVDELPFGVSVVPGTFGGTCTGFWDTDPGDSGVLLHSGGSLAGNGSCTLTVDVTSSTVGTALNISDPIYATQSGYNTSLTTGIAQASLLVLASPEIAKEFVPNLLLLGVTPNDASTLTFTVTNPNPDDAIGGVSFSDSLPAGLEVASPPNAATSGCGAPTWAPTAGATSLSFSGGSIAAGDACTVTVDVTGPIGLYDNVSSAATHIVSGEPATNGEVAEASLQIDEPIPGVAVQKLAGPGSDPDLDPWSDYVAVLPGQDVFYKIVVENTGEVPLTGLVVSDPDVDTSGCIWPNPLPVADVFDNHIATCIVGPVAAVAGTHDNTASAEANSSAGPVDDSDSATYATVGLSFSKVADPLTYATAGDIVDYTFTVTNSGAAILAGPVTLTDPLVPGATCESVATVGNLDGFFDPGESVECTGSYTIQAIDITNLSVTNTAYASVGGFDSPNDSATVTTCAPGPCCVAGSYLTAGTTCRAASGVCDVAETCTGTSSDCPADAFEPNTTVCRASGGACDVAENCTGAGAACPADTFAASTVECRASGGVCDVAENCTGASAACPADVFAASTVECRASGGVCDVAENCTGAGAACPADAFAASTVECRASGGVCDVAEVCSGTAAACPADAFEPSTTICRNDAGLCDVAEVCTGTSSSCPADAFEPVDTSCGSPSDSACDNPDSCDGSGNCQVNNEPATTVCRASAGVCDVAENCDGFGSCPADTFAASTVECRGSGGVCDLAENCTGADAACPADAFAASTVECRASGGVCDVAENCTGADAACPADAFAASTVECRASGGVCDVAENCTGADAACPADAFAASTVECRASGGVCDVAENCTGAGAACPADAFVASTVECRASGGVCDVAENCTGAAAACPADAFVASTVECRASSGVCDVAETCTGAAAACPADAFAASTVECRASGGVCDVAENCTGAAAACPADAFAASTVECRASGGVCDVAENCTGAAAACPADAFAASTLECRASGGVCDVAENCTGAGAACPADAFAASTLECRASGGVCDVAENCTGAAAACPADAFAASTVECRASGGVCDLAENCTGAAAACPADVFAASTVECRASGGVCDLAENCTGGAAACPADAFAASTVECRASGGTCDVAENCTGAAAACPADAFGASTVECRASGGVCDVAENCTGAAAACPADAFAASTVECRASGGVCDLAENCTGAAAACPADVFAASTVECRASGGVCDAAENCTGADAACPADALAASTVECRASAGVCDVAENCTGADAACPADGVAPSTTTCRASTGVCDIAENCDGIGATCPADVLAATTVECRPASGECDVAEVCTGVGGACPVDAFVSSGFPCGSSGDTICDNPDSCDGAGACAPNYELASVECRAAAGECDLAENCDGAGLCAPDVFAPVLTACGDPSDTDCDNPDTCDGAGMCLANSDPGNPICASADLAITITDLTGPVQAGAFTTYQVDVSNLGPDDADDTVATIVLDPNTTFVATSGPCVQGPVGTLVCTFGTVGAGTTTTFEIVVHVDPAAPTAGTDTGPVCPGGEDLCAPATVTSSTPDSNPSNNASEVATDVIVAVTFAEISLTKIDIATEPVAPGDSVTYEITVFNNGTDDATDVMVYESLDPFMTYVSDTAGCTVTASALGDELACPLGTIADGMSASFQVVVTINMDAPLGSVVQDGDCNDLEDVCNSAVVTTSASDAVFTNNDDSEPTDVSPAVLCGNSMLDPGEQCDPPSGEVCNNGMDDDGDMLADCADPQCLAPGFQSCDGACQLTVPCVPILDDPARISDRRIVVHGRYIPTTDANPFLDGFTFLVTNAEGDIYRANLLAGDMRLVGGVNLKRWVFKDRGAKKGTGIRGGIYRAFVKERREKDGSISYAFNIKAFGDMTRAVVPKMTTQIYIGNDVGHLTAEWLGKPGRWWLTRKQAEEGRGE